MRDDRGDLDITEYLAKLPDKGRCLIGEAPVVYIERDGTTTTTYAPKRDVPVLQGSLRLPLIASSDMRLVPLWYTPIWDANRYYRDLGISFPFRPTRKQLRLAYFDRGGLDNAHLTRVMKLLLTPKLRREYDATPLGQPYLDDDLQSFLKRRAQEEARQRGGGVTDEEVLNEWGLEVDPDASTEDVESEPQAEYGEDSDQDTAPDKEVSDPSPTVTPWNWAYYTWHTDQDDTERLATWQQLLVRAFSHFVPRFVQPRRFAVGFQAEGDAGYFAVTILEGHLLILLREDQEPTRELAELAVFEEFYKPYSHKNFDRQVTGAGHAQIRAGW